jgi:hypothetical protein
MWRVWRFETSTVLKQVPCAQGVAEWWCVLPLCFVCDSYNLNKEMCDCCES